MLNIILYQPEIPPNTGNIIRLAANTGCRLHLIRPYGFEFEDRLLRRAGLDYHEWARVSHHDSLQDLLDSVPVRELYAFSTRGTRLYSENTYRSGDALLFGPETRGLPQELLDGMPPDHVARLPMQSASRSLNLSNTVAIAVYEAWRQLDFAPLESPNSRD